MIGYIYYPVNISNLCWLIIAFKRNLENWIKIHFLGWQHQGTNFFFFALLQFLRLGEREREPCEMTTYGKCEIILNKFFCQLIPIQHFSFAPLEGETFTVNVTVSLYFYFFHPATKTLADVKMSFMSLDPCSGAHHVPEPPPLFCGNCGHVSPFPANLSTRRLTVS